MDLAGVVPMVFKEKLLSTWTLQLLPGSGPKPAPSHSLCGLGEVTLSL